MITSPGYPLTARVDINGQNLFCCSVLAPFNSHGENHAWFVNMSLVLSPTTYFIPFCIQARMASPLCNPVIAGGIRPEVEYLRDDEIPACDIHARLNEISLTQSSKVALFRASWVLPQLVELPKDWLPYNVWDKCMNASLFFGFLNHCINGSRNAQVVDHL